MRLIQANHLKTWAAPGSRVAQANLPKLVRDLVVGSISSDHLEKVYFPFGDSVRLPGVDGLTVCDKGNLFVPEGGAVWELGVGDDYRRKFQEDYSKRIEDKKDRNGNPVIPGNRADITFVFVTPHEWENKEAFLGERKKDGIWKDVVIIDAVDLIPWFELVPPAALEFAAENGIAPTQGVATIDMAWEEWSHLSEPATTEALATAGREGEAKDLIERLEDFPSIFSVRGDSSREAWGFTLAVLRRYRDEKKGDTITPRVVIVDNESIARGFSHHDNLILLIKSTNEQISGALSGDSRHVIIAEGNKSNPGKNIIKLSRPNPSQAHKAFVEMGIPEEDAWKLVHECGLSVTVFQRLKASANNTPPHWATREATYELIPALLAGRWDHSNEADKEILKALASLETYEDVLDRLAPFLREDDPPLQRIRKMWALTSSVDSFQLTAKWFRHADLRRFKSAFKTVFEQIDPKVELPQDEWPFFDGGENKKHSSWLRSGLAETLLLIAELGSSVDLVHDSPKTFAEEVIGQIENLDSDWRVLASLRDQFPILMEAAPSPLLEGLEVFLEANPQDFVKLFAEGNSFFGGGSMHTGILWGLETLAWGERYLPKVTMILATMANIDPGGRLGNRPINSLREIFLWWHPGTFASDKVKLDALNRIVSKFPEVGWDLLSKLLPSRHSSASPTRQPQWMVFGDEENKRPVGAVSPEYVTAIVSKAIEHAGEVAERWSSLLRSLSYLSKDNINRALATLEETSQGISDAKSKSELFEVVRESISRHRAYNEAEWALPEHILTQLEDVQHLLTPSDVVSKNKWLFEEWFPDRSVGERSYEARKEKSDNFRRKAAQEVYEAAGLEGIASLGTSCRYPGFLAEVLPDLLTLEDLQALIDKMLAYGEAGENFACHISSKAYAEFGEEWKTYVVEAIIGNNWSITFATSLFLFWPNQMTTWRIIESQSKEIQSAYWENVPVNLLVEDMDEQTYQIEKLIEARRAATAFDRIAMDSENTNTQSLLSVFDATIDELFQIQTTEEANKVGISSYEVMRVLETLRARQDIADGEIYPREYVALPLLGIDAKGLALHDYMISNPEFFMEVICDLYLPASRDKDGDREPDPYTQNKANAAYRLLQGIAMLPGQNGDDVDLTFLSEWIGSVREIAEAKDRIVVVDLQIGHILAHSPDDPVDKGWPHRSVREILESYESEDIGRGIITERFNMRGTYSKGLYEGGDQERELANKYSSWAEISEDWERTSKLLKAISKNWSQDAEREDARAEQDKLRR